MLGIVGKDGTAAEYLTLPATNLHVVPDEVGVTLLCDPFVRAFCYAVRDPHTRVMLHMSFSREADMGGVLRCLRCHTKHDSSSMPVCFLWISVSQTRLRQPSTSLCTNLCHPPTHPPTYPPILLLVWQVSDEEAVYAEPLAAAARIVEQGVVKAAALRGPHPGRCRVAVIGDGGWWWCAG